MKKSSVDLTSGNITKQIIIFALPLLVGQIFQNLYNSVDSIVVGNAVGTTALAAVSASADIAQILTGFFTGLSTGSSVIFGRCFGAHDNNRLRKAIHTAICFAVIIGVSMAGLGIILAPSLLKISDCPAEVYDEALTYLRIYLVGILFTAIYNIGASVLRAVGDSKNPFLFLVISSVTNIILDVVLVVSLKMGVAGAAIATIISQSLSVVLVFRKLMITDDVYKFSIKELGIDKELLKEVISLGLPAAVQACLISVSNMFLLRYINSFGTEGMAGIGIGKKVDKFIGMVGQSVGLSTATFVSQNVGAKKYSRAFDCVRTCIVMSFVYVLISGTALFIFAPQVSGLFSKDSAVCDIAAAMIRTMMPFYILQGIYQVISNAVRGFGKSFVVMIVSMIGMIGVRQLFLAIALSIEHNINFIYLAWPVGWIGAFTLCMIYYWFAIRKKFYGLSDAEAVQS